MSLTPRHVCELVDERARLAPEREAASDGARTLTFAALVQRAAALAGSLGDLGVRTETRVAVLLERSLDLLVSSLGIWHAGGTVALLDPAWPEERLRRALARIAPALVVTCRAVASPPAGYASLLVEEVEASRDAIVRTDAHLDQLAYITSTSGSTGTPKLVGTTHRAVAHGISTQVAAHRITADDRGSWLSPPASSLTGNEWRFIAAGASVHVAPDHVVASARALQAWLLERRVTKALVGMPVAEQLYRLPWPEDAPLRLVLVGGDQVRTWADANLPFEVAVEYGSAEADAVCSSLVPWDDRCTSRTASALERATRPAIGRAWPGVRLRIVDGELADVAPGALGELCVGGPHLARGYLDDPSLTAQRFLPDASGPPGSRLYRTGDLVRLRPDGLLEHHGRLDAQLKILGQRVDPAEVEAALLSHPGVRAAAVAAKVDREGATRLVAYLVADRVPAHEVRALAERQLPRHAVPTAYVSCTSLPVNSHGKLDRSALPEPDWSIERERPAAPPVDDVERELLSIWARELRTDDVGVDDDLFACGGDSFTATGVVEEVYARFGVEIRLRDVLERRTPARIATLVRERSPARTRAAGAGELDAALEDALRGGVREAG